MSNCRKQFADLGSNADSHWHTVLQNSLEFAEEHGIPCEFPDERRRKKKRRLAEGEGEDECLDGRERAKVETFIAVLDEVNRQMNSRFAEQQVEFMAQLWHFTLLC